MPVYAEGFDAFDSSVYRRHLAVERAHARRRARAAKQNLEIIWYIDRVITKIKMTEKKRVRFATEYIKNKVIRNISSPVTKTVKTRYVTQYTGHLNKKSDEVTFRKSKKKVTYTVVTRRSVAGEFPAADTTQLMKSIFSDYDFVDGVFDGFVGTPIDYGLILELYEDRSFLQRTLLEEIDKVVKILSGPIK